MKLRSYELGWTVGLATAAALLLALPAHATRFDGPRAFGFALLSKHLSLGSKGGVDLDDFELPPAGFGESHLEGGGGSSSKQGHDFGSQGSSHSKRYTKSFGFGAKGFRGKSYGKHDWSWRDNHYRSQRPGKAHHNWWWKKKKHTWWKEHTGKELPEPSTGMVLALGLVAALTTRKRPRR